jgi:hypothetical protein
MGFSDSDVAANENQSRIRKSCAVFVSIIDGQQDMGAAHPDLDLSFLVCELMPHNMLISFLGIVIDWEVLKNRTQISINVRPPNLNSGTYYPEQLVGHKIL